MRVDNLSVRDLAEFVFQPEDLYATRVGRVVEAEEGVQAQKMLQAKRMADDPGYQREVSVQAGFHFEDRQYVLQGRVDGIAAGTRSTLVEEFKCVGASPVAAAPADWGQVLLYAGLLAQSPDKATTELEVRLVYVEADGYAETHFTTTLTREQAEAILHFALLCYTARLHRHLARTRVRQDFSGALPFPFSNYRKGQRGIARRVFQALRNDEQLLLEAPTGAGKSLAVLFPAVRGLQKWEQLFFMTARNAGAEAALRAVTQLDPKGEFLVTVEITAKEKICPVQGMPCAADQCPNAKGYFTRRDAAIDEVVQAKLASRATVSAIAESHTVCPFELSLDAAQYADVVIGDYNYVLDPVVRLKRFVGHKNVRLLVDEAHQLAPRAREMLTVEVCRKSVREATGCAQTALSKGAASIDRALLKMRREYGVGEHVVTDKPQSLERAMIRFMDVCSETGMDLTLYPEIAELVFVCARWKRAREWVGDAQTVTMVSVVQHEVTVRRVCLDTATYLQQRFAEYGPSIRFSGTLSPMPVFQRLHGCTDAPQARAESPFAREQLKVLIVDDIPTYYRQRHESLPQLAGLIEAALEVHAGHYLVALSSYVYANMAAEMLEQRGAAQHTLFTQTPGMSKEAMQSLLEEFQSCAKGVLVIVMGGSLGESVDFSQTRLDGVFIVGLGLPPPGLERNLLADYFEAQTPGWGQLVAYTEPALTKIMQTAGRLIRDPADRGVLFLVDHRYLRPHIQTFFPAHWRGEKCHSRNCVDVLEAFWTDSARSR